MIPLKNAVPETNLPTILALTEAGEFLLCAVRALASGASLDDHDVRLPMTFVKAKIAEAFAHPTGAEVSG